MIFEILSQIGSLINFIGEFDPGSGRTLAACLTHASRTEFKTTTEFSQTKVDSQAVTKSPRVNKVKTL